VERVDPSTSFSTPFDAPLVPSFPFEFRNVVILTVLYRTRSESIRRILPSPLEAVDDLVAVHFYQMNDTDHFGAYNESAVQVQAILPSTSERGVYSPYLFLDHDGAIASGREVYGQPKKFGLPTIETRQDLLVGRIRRNDIDVVTATMPYKIQRSSIDDMLRQMDFIANINLKVIPSVDGTDGIRQLTVRNLLNVRVYECWTGPATISILPNAQAPVYLLPVEEHLNGYFWRCDFTLDHGRVIHDYLATTHEDVPYSRAVPAE
jgi:acetoacetate decarboxylase